MIDRPHAFGEQSYSVLDNVIYTLRKRQVIHHLPPLQGRTVLDLGSGYDARLLMDVLRLYPDARGIAVDMAFAPDLSIQSNFTGLTGDLDGPIPVEGGSVDVCVTLAVIEHLHNPLQFLGEIFRVLKPGGCVLLTTPGPTAKPLLEFMAFQLGIIDADEIRDHKNYFSKEVLRQMFTQAGFQPGHITSKTFIFGMNNLVVARKSDLI